MHFFATLDGTFYKRSPGTSTFSPQTLPSTVTVRVTVRRPWGFQFQGKLHVGGLWTKNMVWLPSENRLREAGITAPVAAPTFAAGAGTGLTGAYTGYYSYAQVVSGIVEAESSLSPVAGPITLTNQNVSWGVTASTEARVTAIILYRSVGDSLPGRVGIYSNSTGTITENVADTTVLLATTAALDDTGELDPDARDKPPVSNYAVLHNNRGYYIDGTNRGVWRSHVNEPESVSGNEDLSFIKIPSGEMPLSMASRSSELVVFCASSMWSVREFTEGDYAITRISASDGIIAPFTAINIRDGIFWAGPEGVMLYDGSGIRNLMARSYRTSWIAAYEAAPTYFQNAMAWDNKRGRYILLIPLSTAPKSFYVIGNYRAMFEEGQLEPWWYFWKRDREEFCGAVLTDAGEFLGPSYFGGQDGHVRQEDPTDDSDDSDTYNKKMIIRRPHVYPAGPPGDNVTGRHFYSLDIFCTHENNDMRVACYPGDHSAFGCTTAAYDKTWPATSKAGWMPQDNQHETLGQVSGAGCTLYLEWENALDVEYLGECFWHGPGRHGRTPA